MPPFYAAIPWMTWVLDGFRAISVCVFVSGEIGSEDRFGAYRPVSDSWRCKVELAGGVLLPFVPRMFGMIILVSRVPDEHYEELRDPECVSVTTPHADHL